jgi:hypothetical protein
MEKLETPIEFKAQFPDPEFLKADEYEETYQKNNLDGLSDATFLSNYAISGTYTVPLRDLATRAVPIWREIPDWESLRLPNQEVLF